MTRWGVPLALVLMLAAPATAKDLYVNNSGTPACSDATTYANNDAASPWCTVGRAAWGSTNRAAPNTSEAAQAGDHVYVTAGTYTTVGSDFKFTPAYQPANSGTEESPIVFEAVGAVITTYTSGVGPVIGAEERHWITWKGPWTVSSSTAPTTTDTGSAISWGSHGTVFDGVVLDGTGQSPDDNYPGVRFEYSQYGVVRNSVIRSFRHNSPSNGNGVGIQVYYSGDLLFEHNDISDCGLGIALKAPFRPNEGFPWLPAQIIVRFNLIYETTSGINIHRAPAGADIPTLVYQNIVRSVTAYAFEYQETAQADQPRHSKVVNNSVYGAPTCILVRTDSTTGAANVFRNNICMRASSGGNALYTELTSVATMSDRGRWAFDHNVWYNYGSNFAVIEANRTFAYWQGTMGQDVTSPEGITSDPRYADPTNGDLRLCTGAGAPHASCAGASPALALGRAIHGIGGSDGTTIPAGAYITGDEVIGPTEGEEPPTPTDPVRWRVRFRAG